MADSYTANLNLTLPEVGASRDTWGGKVNADMTAIDTVFNAAGNGTSVGLNVGSGKTLTVAGTATVTGTAQFADGSASAPTIAHSGDTNTGVFFPAADTVAITTAGSERARIDSSGNFTTSSGNDTQVIFGNTGAKIRFRPYITSTGFSQISAVNSAESAYLPISIGGSVTIFESGGAERARIDSSGNFIVGSSTAGSAGLNVAAGYNISFAEGSANTTYTNFFRQASSGAAVIGYGIKYSATANGFASSVGSSFARSAIVADYGSIKFYTDGASTVASGTDITPTERARFDSNGFFFVGMTGTGTTPTNGGAYIKGDVYSSVNDYATIFVPHNSGVAHGIVLKETASATGQQIRFYHGASLVGSVTTTSSATSYNTTSDYRLKENVQPMQNALAKVALLNPVTYTWKENGSDGQGFIAHELQAVCPDAVTGEKDAVRTVDVLDEDGKKIGTKEEPVYQGVDTSFLVATLTKAIQELKAELDAAKAEIEALKAK